MTRSFSSAVLAALLEGPVWWLVRSAPKGGRTPNYQLTRVRQFGHLVRPPAELPRGERTQGGLGNSRGGLWPVCIGVLPRRLCYIGLSLLGQT